MENICIIIPAYNEERRIGRTLENYGAFFEKMRDGGVLDYKILVVINNTKDKTEDIVKIYANHNKNIKYLNFKEGGKGFAIIEGFKEALKKDFSLIGFVDADSSTSPHAFHDLIKNIKSYDGIIASRYVRGSIVKPKQNLRRIMVSRIFNFLIRILFLMNYRDTQCGAKVFKKEAIAKVINKLGLTQWAFDVDLLYNLGVNGEPIKEHPTTWSDKEYSKINFLKSGPRMGLAIIRLRLINSKLKLLIKAYDILPNWMKIHKKIF